MSYANRGSPRENAVAQVLRDFDYLVASRRHEPGAGDLLAAAPAARYWTMPHWLLLIEVKGTRDVPWADTKGFGPERRRELLETARKWNVEPMLAWWPPHLGLIWLPASDWPALR